METESASNEENNEQSKRDHIKERLKEMGVSQDSVRPEKSWIARNINYLIIAVVAILVGAFVIEYQSSSKIENDDAQAAEQNQSVEQAAYQAGNPYYYNQPANGGMGMEMQPPAWAQPQYGNQYADSAEAGSGEQQTDQNEAVNNDFQNGNSGWYAQQRFYGQQPYYGQSYQKAPAHNQQNNQAQTELQNQQQSRWPEHYQQSYPGQYNGYNQYYVPMPNPYAMPYPNTGYYNGWYR